jgi:hypothetical protein
MQAFRTGSQGSRVDSRRDERRLSMIALILAALLGSPSPAAAAPVAAAATPAPTDAYAIFLAARHERTQSGYPRFAAYTTVVRYHTGAVPIVRSWDTIEDLDKRLVFSHGMSREEQAHPVTPEGTNIGVGVGATGVQNVPAPTQAGGSILPGGLTMNEATSDDPLGQVTFAINQDFGLAFNAPSVEQTQDLSDISTSKPFLPHIGSTSTVVPRSYAVSDLGDVMENGARLHHLALRPLRDPEKNRLRELWVDAKTFDVIHAKVSGIGNGTPFTTTAWLIDFRQWEGGTYIERETALDSLEDSGETCTGVTITFENVVAKNSLSPYEQVGITSTTGIADP